MYTTERESSKHTKLMVAIYIIVVVIVVLGIVELPTVSQVLKHSGNEVVF